MTAPDTRRRFEADGFATITRAVTPAECTALADAAAAVAADGPGSRTLLDLAWCRELVDHLRRQPAIAALLPAGFVAVQCTYFEKSRDRNWLVPIHQDLSIPVAEHVPTPELGGWSHKEGGLFVHAPPQVLHALVAMRLHLDPCRADDGPLVVVPGSHTLGPVTPEAAAEARIRGPLATCELQAGDVLAMRPLLLHASSKASGNSRRRVLHLLFGPPQLPLGLQWRHAV